jgi:hypothetical protein
METKLLSIACKVGFFFFPKVSAQDSTMRRDASGSSGFILALSALVLALFIVTPGATAQCPNGTTGLPQVTNSAGTGCFGSTAYYDASAFSQAVTATACAGANSLSNDAAGQIQQAICKLPSTGGTVDARGLNGNQTFKSDPFEDPGTSLTTTKPVTLILGAGTYSTSFTIGIPDKGRLLGVGRADKNNTINTLIIWSGGTPTSNTPVVCMGMGTSGGVESCTDDGVARFGVQIRDLKIDCNGSSGVGANQKMIGIQNSTAQEGSSVEHYVVQGCPVNGILLNSNAAQNSGPYGPGEIYNGSPSSDRGCTANTINFQIGTNSTVNDPMIVNHITLGSGAGCTTAPTTAMDVNGNSIHVEDIHCQNATSCITVGDHSDTIGLQIGSIAGDTNGDVGTLVTISNNGSHTISGEIGPLWVGSGPAATAIVDNSQSPSVTISTLGSVYHIGTPYANSYGFTEQNSGPAGASNFDFIWGVTASHRLKMNWNSGGTSFFIPGSLHASGTLTYGSLTNTCQEQNITVTGATTSMVATASPASSLGSSNLSWSAWVSAANTVSVRICNVVSGSTVTPNAVTWNVGALVP